RFDEQHASTADCGRGVRPGVQAAYPVVDGPRWLRPVDHAVGPRDAVGVGDEPFVLWFAGERTGRQAVDDLDQKPAADVAQAAFEGDAGFVRIDWRRLTREHRTGIERFDNGHDRDAGFGVAGQDGPLNR